MARFATSSARRSSALVAVFAGLRIVKFGIVNVKPAVEARRRISNRIENHGPDKRRRVIALLVKEVGKIRKIWPERRAEVLNVIELRIGSSEQRGVGRGRQRDLRIGTRKNHAVLGQGIEIGSQAPSRSQKTHAVGAGCVEGDQNDVGVTVDCGWTAGWLCACVADELREKSEITRNH